MFIIDKSVCLFIFSEVVYSFILSKAVCFLFIKGFLFVFCPWWFVYLFPRLFICLRIFSAHKTLMMTTAQNVVRLTRISDFGDPRQKFPLHRTVDSIRLFVYLYSPRLLTISSETNQLKYVQYLFMDGLLSLPYCLKETVIART